MNLWARVKLFFSGGHSSSEIIPDNIDQEEILIRGVLRPIHFKNHVISDKLFLPPTGRNDVSILRHNYTTDNFCKAFFANMQSSQQYQGLFALLAKHIHEVAAQYNLSNEISLQVTPLDENKNLVTSRPILANQLGLPMHADIVYKHTFQKGEPQTNYREFSRGLIKTVNKYLEDPTPNGIYWEGPEIKHVFKA